MMEQPTETAALPLAEPTRLATLCGQLASFLQANPTASLEEVERDSLGKGIMVRKLWGDESVAISIPEDDDAVIDALNNVFLPERYTALWHVDTKHFEIIWTAFSLVSYSEELKSRTFKFNHVGTTYECGFGRSSDRLLAIAEHFEPIGPTRTDHRNLLSFYAYTLHKKMKPREPSFSMPIGDPVSFWIKCVEWNEDSVLCLVRHLNFYSTYYDTRSPTIIIHTPKSETEDVRPQTQYSIGKFPDIITSRDIDNNLLDFWAASKKGDAAQRFLYCYRIVEYASGLYLESNSRHAIRKILLSPHVLHDIQQITEEVIAVVYKSKMDDIPRFENLLQEVLDPRLLWREVENNVEEFKAKVTFDGGFSIDPLVGAGAQEVQFLPNCIAIFSKRAREIRNALSHGRDQKTFSVIAPTTNNFRKLQPWVSLMSVAAGEVILYYNSL